MGEPLLNCKHVLGSTDLITSGKQRLATSPNAHYAVSTAGIAKMIRKPGDDGVRFEFALSLHAANDTKRNEIMPIKKSNSPESLVRYLSYFHEKTEARRTDEYIIFKDFNDSLQDAGRNPYSVFLDCTVQNQHH
ncbi:MAG: hypothetical protein IPP17_30615 [Bacteroidetes bacterium]|nr:hypothetical protein [Bacteroidota bacterium]